MIDKVFPRKLNVSKDARVRGKDEMIDAVNVTIDDNYGEAGDGGTGNFGVLKPVKGNIAISGINADGEGINFNGDGKVIGSCVDDRNQKIYYFLYSTTNSEQGVYEYDASANNGAGEITPLITSKYFNFRPNSYVQADVVHIPKGESDPEYKIRPIIFFTDGINEPRKIDVSRAVRDGQSLSDNDNIDFFDFISVCPRTPLDPPTATFQNDPSSKVSNFKGEKGFQFAYQNIYKSGDISALSTISSLYVPSAYINQGTASNPAFFAENYLEVNIPYQSIGAEVERVRLLVRNGNTGSWFIVDEAEISSESDVKINFYNDSIYSILPEGESRKQFDSVPKKALTQTVTNNRLFYGNYVEGFDVPQVSASISNAFQARPQDFVTISLGLTPEIRNVNSTAPGATNNRVACYQLDTSDIPEEGVLAGTQVIFSLTVSPDDNFHFYESRASFHGSAKLDWFDGAGNAYTKATASTQQRDGDFDRTGSSYFGPMQSSLNIPLGPLPNGIDAGHYRRPNVHHNPATPEEEFRWLSPFIPQDGGEETVEGMPSSYGTSAQNPFIIQGNKLEFGGSFNTLVPLSKEGLANVISDMLLGNYGRDSSLFTNQSDSNGDVVSVPLVDIQSRSDEASYSFDLNINNLDKLKVYGNPDPRSKLVVAVGAHNFLTNGSVNTHHVPPCGFFIVNKGTATFTLRDVSNIYSSATNNTEDSAFLMLDLVDLTNWDVMTCVPDVVLDIPELNDTFGGPNYQFFLNDPDAGYSEENVKNVFDGWVCMDTSYVQSSSGLAAITEEQIGAVEGVDGVFKHCGRQMWEVIQNNEITTYNESQLYQLFSFTDPSEGNLPAASVMLGQYRRWLGVPIPINSERQVIQTADGRSQVIYTQGRLITTLHNYNEYVKDEFDVNFFFLGQNPAIYFEYAFSLVDGEAGPGSLNQGSQWGGMTSTSVAYASIVGGVAPWGRNIPGGNNMPLLTGTQQFDYWNFANLTDTYSSDLNLVDFIDYQSDTGRDESVIEVFSFETIIIPPNVAAAAFKSFKTKAVHDFGIVFYDQRGRSSDVVPIGSTYVGDYATSGSNKGPVQVQVTLSSPPPSWAWHYQIVYGGNSTVGDFVQYTSGGAWVEYSSEENNGNIYVSLNYLQENSDVSYSEAFGAIRYDGNKDFYTYKEGDKLRIISYFDGEDLSTRVYPEAYEFDVVGVKTFGENENPLVFDSYATPKAATGQFLVLRNNPSAVGFSYNSVKRKYEAVNAGGVSVSGDTFSQVPLEASTDLWNNRCVVEIYSPLKNQEAEDRVYYEISKKYRVIRDTDASNAITWEKPTVVMNNGDVYFRRHPVNIAEYNATNNVFVNLIQGEGSDNPRFLDYYLETKTFNDTLIGANQHDWGKPKIANRFQREIRRDSSLTFSDVNNYALPTLRFTSFDATTSNFKDLPNNHGSIQSLIDRGDSVFVIQEDKCSDIPISRTLLSDSVGTDIVVASEKVLGTQRFYSGDYGCSDNPESVVSVGENIYFANKEKYEVYKFNPANGIAVISEYGLKSYFKDLFSTAISNTGSAGRPRVVGGYDPLLDEYIISVYNQATLSVGDDQVIDQDTGTQDPDPPVVVVDDLQEQVDTLLEENLTLQTDLENALSDITSLQNQLQELLDQLGAAINDPLVEDPVVFDLSQEIGALNEELAAAEDVLQGQIISGAQLHGTARRQAETSITLLDSFIGQLQLDIDRNLYANTDFVVPSTIDDQFLPSGVAAGGSTDLQKYQLIAINIRTKLYEYNATTDLQNPGKFDTNYGQYTKKDGSVFSDYLIGYGLPTDDSLNDEDLTSLIPIGSALYDDPNFIVNLLGNPNLPTDYGYTAQASQLINLFGVTALADQQGKIEDLEDEITVLDEDKQDLLAQVANFIGAMYTAKGDSPEKPDNPSVPLYPFGVSYTDPEGNPVGGEDNALINLRNAYLADGFDGTQEANKSNDFTNLEAFITLNPQSLASLRVAIETGIGGYSFPFQGTINENFSEIETIEVVRDGLANSFYNSVSKVSDLSKEVGGAANLIYVQGSGLPETFFDLVVNGGSPTAQQIVESLGGTFDYTPSDIAETFGSLFDNITALLEGGTVSTGGGITDDLKIAVAQFMTALNDEIFNIAQIGGSGQFGDNQSLTFENYSSNDLAVYIQNRKASLIDSEGDGTASLGSQIANLKAVLQEALDGILLNGFFSNDQAASNNPVNDFNQFLLTPQSILPFSDTAYNLASNVSKAITALNDFQTLFGTQNDTSIITPTATGSEPNLGGYIANISERSNTYGKGYTGDGGSGLTAQKLASGVNVDMGAGGSGGNGFVSSYIGLYNALDAIIGKQIGQYTSFQNTSTGDLNGDLAWSFGGTPIIFNGNAQDVLSSSAYNTLKNIIEQAYDPNANTNTGVDPNLVAGLINQVFNSAIENTIDTATDVARGLVFGKEGAPAGTQTISTYADAYELATTQSGDALNVEANLTALNERYSLASRREPYGDYNDNNSIDSNDLISFLADFGTEPSAPLNVISAPSSDTAIRNLIDQRKYKTFDVQYELSNPLGPVPTTTETDDFTNNLTAAINNLLGDALNGTVAFLNGEFIVIPN
jgi:hypothetical protein